MSDNKVNHEAYLENEKNRKHVSVTHGGGITTMFIDQNNVTYKGVRAKDLSDEHKKKLENLVLFMHIASLKQIPKIVYR